MQVPVQYVYGTGLGRHCAFRCPEYNTSTAGFLTINVQRIYLSLIIDIFQFLFCWSVLFGLVDEIWHFEYENIWNWLHEYDINLTMQFADETEHNKWCTCTQHENEAVLVHIKPQQSVSLLK